MTTSGGEQVKREPIVRASYWPLADIIARFHQPETSVPECHALLSLLVFRYDEELRHPAEVPAAAMFLMEVGSEHEPHPSVAQYGELRHRARIILARHILRYAVSARFDADLVARLVTFYAAHEDHADLNERDRTKVHGFFEGLHNLDDERTPPGIVARAFVNLGAWHVIEGSPVFEAIIPLCVRIARDTEMPAPMMTERIWNPVLRRLSEDPSAMTDCMPSEGLVAGDLLQLAIEVEQLVVFCGKALDAPCYDDKEDEQSITTLLWFLSRTYAAVRTTMTAQP